MTITKFGRKVRAKNTIQFSSQIYPQGASYNVTEAREIIDGIISMEGGYVESINLLQSNIKTTADAFSTPYDLISVVIRDPSQGIPKTYLFLGFFNDGVLFP